MIETMSNQVMVIKKVFNDLEKLINDMSNDKVKQESAIKRVKRSIAELQ